MSTGCNHIECQVYDRCKYQPVATTSAAPVMASAHTHTVKSWLDAVYTGNPDEDQQPAGSQPQQEDSDVIEKIPESTHQDDALDTLVSRASIPNLGALIKQGIKQGLIAPTATYN